MTITAKNVGRIDVWPDAATALAADTEESKVLRRMTIWKTTKKAKEHKTHGGNNNYIARAVHFDGTVSFGISSLSAPADSGLVLISVWCKLPSNPETTTLFFQIDGRQPGGAYASAILIANGAELPDFDVYLSDSASNNYIGTSGYDVTPTEWTHFLIYADVNHADPDKVFKVYKNDVDVTYLPQRAGPAFVMTWNGKSLDIGSAGDETNFVVGDFADFRILIPSIPLHDEADGLPEITRRLFIDDNNKPVDPAIATAANLGTDIVLCAGDAIDFVGTFTPSAGSMGALTDADTSPSD